MLGHSHQDGGDVLSVVLFLIPFECVSQLPQIKESEKEPLTVVIENFRLTFFFLIFRDTK